MVVVLVAASTAVTVLLTRGHGAPSAAPATLTATGTALTGTRTQITLAPSFLTALEALKVTPTSAGTATLIGGVMTVPITGGHVTTSAPFLGEIDHQGAGLTLTADGMALSLSDFAIEPAAAAVYARVAVNGTVLSPRSAIFDLRGLDGVRVSHTPGSAVWSGISLTLMPETADVLDRVYRTRTVTSGLVVGAATITLSPG